MRRSSSRLLSIRKPPHPVKVFAPVTVSSSPSSSSQPIPEEPQATQEEESRASPKAPASSELRVSPASRTSPVPRPSLAPTCATSAYSQTVGRSVGIRKCRHSSSSADNGHGIFFQDEEQKLRYASLHKRVILPTRYLDENSLNTLGMLEDMTAMLRHIGWTTFTSFINPAYERITLEFLSSVSAEILQGKNCEEGLIKFRLHNTDYTLELAELNAIFGFPSGGERRYPRIFNEHAFWCRLSTTSQFVSSDSKESHIHHPCFRYAHRLLAHTLFARGDSIAAVKKSELLFM